MLQSLMRFNEVKDVKNVKKVKRVKEPLRDDNTFKYVYETNVHATEVTHTYVFIVYVCRCIFITNEYIELLSKSL